MDGAVGQRGDEHPAAIPHQQPRQVRQHERLAGPRRPLDQVQQVGGVRHGHRFHLAFVQAAVAQHFPGALVAGKIDLGSERPLDQRQDDRASALGIGNGIERIQIERAGIEPVLVHDPAVQLLGEKIFISPDQAGFQVGLAIVLQFAVLSIFISGIPTVQHDQVALAEARVVGRAGQADDAVLHVLDVQPFDRPAPGDAFLQRARPLAGKLLKLGFRFILDELAKAEEKFGGGLGHGPS